MQNVTALKQTRAGVQNAIAYLKNESSDAHAVGYYYKEDGKERSGLTYWGGNLTLALKLEGKEVTIEAMTKLAEGFAPDDGRALCQNA
ncbi:relaxase domain-containing protein, partial [Stenotrophomonas sp. CASM106]